MKEIALGPLLQTLTVRRLFNIARVFCSFIISKLLRRSVVWGTPFMLTVEPSSRCNLHCPQCSTGAGKLTRCTGLLDLEVYRRLIEEIGDKLVYMQLFNQGEPFLHPQIIDFIKIAKRKKIYVCISTNGHFFNDYLKVQNLIESGLDMLIVSLDGADEKTYSLYRVGGDFQKVLRGMHLLREIRNKLQSKVPVMALQFLVMKHNEHQVAAIRQLADTLGIRKLLLKSVQVEDYQAAQTYLPHNEAHRRYIFEGEKLKLKANLNATCHRLWTSTVLLSDGSIVPCCFDKDGQYRFGSIPKDLPFKKIWHVPEYNQFRNKNLHQRGSIEICNNCTQGLKIYN